MSDGWIGVDLDGTLSVYDGWHGCCHIGPPVQKMVDRVKGWLASGYTVKVMTARAGDEDPRVVPMIKAWCKENIGQELEVTDRKDYSMIELWDDRAVHVVRNTGEMG